MVVQGVDRALGTSSQATPKGWPLAIKYITDYTWSSELSRETLQFMTQRSSSQPFPCTTFGVPKGPVGKVRIKAIQDPSHPANGQSGLFATQVLAPKTLILNYIGLVTVNGKESKTSDYTMLFVRNLPGCEDLVIDAELVGNEARHINDYRGVSEKPNAEFKNYRDVNGKVRVGVWVLNEKIKKGSEILVSYGKGFWKARTS